MPPTEFIQRVGNKIQARLHHGQIRAWDSLARFIVVLAGTQGGKTSYGPLWLWREIENVGHGDYLAATATYDLFRLKMLPELLKFFKEMWGWEYRAGDRVLETANRDTRIILRSAESPGGLESATAKGAWCDEWGQDSVSIDAQEAVERRLSLAQGRQLITTTPYNVGWIKQRFWDRWKGGDPSIEVINFRSIDNPAFPRAEYDRAREVMPEWKFLMFYDGLLTRPAGLIYGDYSDSYAHVEPTLRDDGVIESLEITGDGNLVRPFAIPVHWCRHVGLDFGPVHSSMVWLAEEPWKSRYFLYRESMMDGRTVREYAADALAYQEAVVSWRGGTGSENQQRLDWNLQGIPVVEPHVKGIEPQIDRVISAFRRKRLYVFDTCNGVRSELTTYSRELDDVGEPTAKIKDDVKFHRLAALRYGATVFPDEGEEKPQEAEEVDPRRIVELDARRVTEDDYVQVDVW